MDQKQFDALLSDAETRLRRLKVLYEQWFMGIERVEPGLVRKEFEDLLARMRKEQTNNTAQRFRLQQLVQRHVALSTHWRRVGRQIEEGTYQRDLLRAKRRKQPGGQARDADEPELDVTYDVEVDEDLAAALEEADRLAHAPPAPSEYAAQPSKRGRTQAGVGPNLPLAAAGSVRPSLQPDAGPPAHSLSPFAVPGADGQRSKSMLPSAPSVAPAPLNKQPLAAAAASARGAAPPAGARPGSPPAPGELLGGVVSGRMSAPHAAAPPAPGSAGRAPQTGAQAAGNGAPPPQPPGLGGRMSQAGAPPIPGERARMPPAPGPGGRAALPNTGAATATDAGAANVAGRASSPQAGAASVGARGLSPHPGAASAGGRAASPPGATAAGGGRPSIEISAVPGGRGAAPLTAAGPPTASRAPRATASPTNMAGTASGRPATSGAAPAAAAARAAATARAAQAPASPPKTTPAAQGGGPFSAQDVDRVYNQYVAARGRNAERTDNVKRETIEKTIRGMLPQLEQKHPGKKVDFEVVVKDGRVALKPVAK